MILKYSLGDEVKTISANRIQGVVEVIVIKDIGNLKEVVQYKLVKDGRCVGWAYNHNSIKVLTNETKGVNMKLKYDDETSGLKSAQNLLEQIAATEIKLNDLKAKQRSEIRIERLRTKALKKLTEEEKEVLGL